MCKFGMMEMKFSIHFGFILVFIPYQIYLLLFLLIKFTLQKLFILFGTLYHQIPFFLWLIILQCSSWAHYFGKYFQWCRRWNVSLSKTILIIIKRRTGKLKRAQPHVMHRKWSRDWIQSHKIYHGKELICYCTTKRRLTIHVTEHFPHIS